MSVLPSEAFSSEDVASTFTGDIAPATKRRGRQPYPRDDAGNIIRPDGSTSKAAGRSKVNLEAQLNGFVTVINTFVNAYKPLYALDPIEVAALVKALNQQCQVSPKFRKYIEKALSGFGGVNLVGVLVLIATRRVARSGILPIAEGPISPQDIDNICGTILFASTNKPISTLQAAQPNA